MSFPPSFVDELRARLALSDVVGRRVSFDRRRSQPGRGDWWGCCPFHHEKTPSFHVDDSKGFYHCFGCGAGGDVVKFVMETEGLSFPEAVERLAREAGLPLPERTPRAAAAEKARASLHEVVEKAAAFFEAQLWGSAGATARAYLESRGVQADTARLFRIGFAPSARHALGQHLATQGVELAQALAAGLLIQPENATPYDRFRNRLIFPIEDRQSRVIAFGGRALDAGAPAKYLNSPETPLFHKGAVLYNWHRARRAVHERPEAAPIVVEGYMDVIALHQAGFAEATAPLGTALGETQLDLLWRAAPEPLLCFDGDAAGLRAASKLAERALPLLKPGRSLRFVLLPQGQDPDDLLRLEGVAAFRACLQRARPLADMLWEIETAGARLDTPEQRAALEARLSQRVASIADATVRAHYQSEMRGRLARLFGSLRARAAQAKGRPPRSGQRGRWVEPAYRTGGASRELGRTALARPTANAATRCEQLLLLAVIHHPDLLHHHLEELAALPLSVPELDKLRARLVDVAVQAENLDTNELTRHLTNSPEGAVLDRLVQSALSARERFVLPGADVQEAEMGWDALLAWHRRWSALQADYRQAVARMGEDMSEDNYARYLAVRAELVEMEGGEAAIEPFVIPFGTPGPH